MNNQDNNRIVALLPMKANSTRVPGKNFRDFCGKPLFRWTLDTLLEVNEIDQIVINTDAREILREKGLQESEKIKIRDREPKLCGDEVSMNLVLFDDLENTNADIYIMTHTTNPMLSGAFIRKALKYYTKKNADENCDSLFSVNKHQTRFYLGDGTPVNHDPQELVPTQDLVPWYEENSNLYIFTKKSFMKTNARIGGKPTILESPALESVDIDTPKDWEIAEFICKAHKSIKGGGK